MWAFSLSAPVKALLHTSQWNFFSAWNALMCFRISGYCGKFCNGMENILDRQEFEHICITISLRCKKVKRQGYFLRVPLDNEGSYSVRLDPDECGHAPWECGFDWMELRKSDSHNCHFRPSALWCGMPMQSCLRNVYHTACTPKVSSRLIHVLPCVSEKENKLHWDDVTRRLDESNYH